MHRATHTDTLSAPRPGRLRIGWWVMAILALGMAIVATVPYLRIDPAPFHELPMDRFASARLFERASLYLHIIPTAIALIIGPLQFITRLRVARPRVHRWIGRVYLVAVLLGGIGALLIAPRTAGGFPSAVGFSMLAVLWLLTAFKAYQSIRNGDVPQHRAWMIRNYALTFAGVTLRLYAGVLVALLQPSLATSYANDADALFMDAYRTVAWLAWVPNLIVAEWLWVWRVKTAPQTLPTHARRVEVAMDMPDSA